MTHLIIGVFILAALLVYVPRVVFVALGLLACIAFGFIFFGPAVPPRHDGQLEKAHQIECEAKTAAAVAANRIAAPPKPGQDPWDTLIPVPQGCERR